MDNITIVGNDLTFICEDIADPEGFDFPTVRSVYLDPPNKEGSLYINSLAGARVVSWRGLIKTDIQNKRRELAAACYPGSLKTIKFSTCDGIALQAYGEVEKLINPYRLNRSPYLLEFKIPDPRFYGQTLKSENTFITESEGGTPIPTFIPAPIGGGSSLSFVIENEGNVYSKPIFTVRGPGTNFLIQNIDTGEKINLNLTLLPNESVIIDTSTDSVTKGNQKVFGSAARTPSGQWIRLIPGNNRIVFNAQSGFNNNTRLTVEWRDAYGGV
jgi:hypothetical protein